MPSDGSGDEGSFQVPQGVVPQLVPQLPPGATEATQIEEGGPDREKDDAANAVSVLQEYIQSCSSFSPHTKILTWSFGQQLENDTSLQFRATVSFVFGDVPHHFCGGWQTSKKKAQRDTAERVRHYLSRRPEAPAEAQAEGGSTAHAVVDPDSLPSDVLEEMQGALADDGKQGFLLEWKVEEKKSLQEDAKASSILTAPLMDFRTTVTFHIQDVPHHFCGSWCESAGLARRDTLERVLWYFGKSSDVFVAADRANLGACAAVVPPHELTLSTQGGGATATRQGQTTDDKTVLMQVQNALQKAFAKDTPPGQRVWVWSYEADPHDPQLFRAHVEVPSWSKTFMGDWARGKKLAQRSACLIVKSQLDADAQLGLRSVATA